MGKMTLAWIIPSATFCFKASLFEAITIGKNFVLPSSSLTIKST